jgi:integrase
MPRQRNGIWYADFREINPKTGVLERFRPSLGRDVTSRRQALERERELREDLRREARKPAAQRAAERDEPPRAAFSGFARLWLDTHVRVKRKPSVFRRYDSICKVHLVPYFRDEQLTAIDALRVEQLMAWATERTHPDTGNKLKPKTVNEIVGCLSSMLSTAVRWKYLKANPCEGLERLALPPEARTFRFYTAEQSEAFLAKAAELVPEWYPLFLVGFRTGLRLGELFALEWGDVDLVTGALQVRRSHHRGETTMPKSGKERSVDMAPSVVTMLKSCRHMRGPLVFCAHDGTHLNRDMLKHPWERVTLAAGLPRIRPHDMRHSFASQLVIRGVPLRAVQQLLGHATIQMTERYAHLAPGATRAHVALLDCSDSGSGHNLVTPGTTGGPRRRNHKRKVVEAAGVELSAHDEDESP